MSCYTLMHGEIPVLDVEVDEPTGTITKIGVVHEYRHIPVGIPVRKKIVDRASLNQWWTGRSIPSQPFWDSGSTGVDGYP